MTGAMKIVALYTLIIAILLGIVFATETNQSAIYFAALAVGYVLLRIRMRLKVGKWRSDSEALWVPYYCLMWFFFSSWFGFGPLVTFLPITVLVGWLVYEGYRMWSEQRTM